MNEAYSAYMHTHYVMVTAPLPLTKTNLETVRDFGKQTRDDLFDKHK
jgi:hypothetical protein